MGKAKLGSVGGTRHLNTGIETPGIRSRDKEDSKRGHWGWGSCPQ